MNSSEERGTAGQDRQTTFDAPCREDAGQVRGDAAVRQAQARSFSDKTESSVFAGAAIVILTLGLLVRVLNAVISYLNSDEILRLMAVHLPYAGNVYAPGASNPQPLYELLLRLWPWSGDFLLRLPSLLASGMAMFFFFLWMQKLFGRTAALLGALILALLPQAIVRMSDVQAHAFLCLFVAAALYFGEEAWQSGSIRKALLVCLAVMLGTVVHQAGLAVALALGVYGLFRVRKETCGHRTLLVVGSGLLVSLLVYIIVRPYQTVGQFRLGRDGIVTFTLMGIFRTFELLFQTRESAWISLGLFAAGVFLLATGREGRRKGDAALLLLPFFIFAFAAMLGVVGYGQISQVFVLVIFISAGIGIFLAHVSRRFFWPVFIGSATLLVVANMADQGGVGRWRWAARGPLVQAIEFVREAVPQGSLVFTDVRTQIILQRYLGETFQVPFEAGDSAFFEVHAGGYHLVCPIGRWYFSGAKFDEDFFRLSETYQAERGSLVCVVTIGVGSRLAYRLRAQPRSGRVKLFGSDIAVFPMPVLGDGLQALADRMIQRSRQRWRAVFWPTSFLDEWTRQVVQPLADEVVPYQKLYQVVKGRGGRQLMQRLPALAFWAFGTSEEHPEYMRYMDEAEDYAWGALSFKLVELDEAGVAGVYLIDSPLFAALDSVLPAIVRGLKMTPQFIFFPTDFLTDRARRVISRLPGEIISYDDLYKQLRKKAKGMNVFLPALAFWEFGTGEWHPEFMRYMDYGENYISAGLRFTYLGSDPGRIIGVYVIESYAGENPGEQP